MNEQAVKARKQRWAGHRAKRREELVEAALTAIRRHGPAVSVAAIAAEAGVTKPVLYRHFSDRADLQRAVSERAAKILLEKLVPELGRPLPPVDRIRALIGAFLAGAEEEPELWHFVVHSQDPGPAGAAAPQSDVVAHNFELIAGMLTSLLTDNLRALGQDAGGAEAWAFGLVGMVYTAGDWWLQRRTMSREALVDYLTQLIWQGLSGPLQGAPLKKDAPEGS
ncbi:AcrR family transcriptional regulator [Pseudonocardia eucalypti]|uniref:TetR family transcriptional regulator n=1 Tax=Pseudonocardia eucalypti TaxID=648755 RepID=UPI001608AB67|nr:AcrR family transcriptional regulator [Pseudonocardia eucalypti]